MKLEKNIRDEIAGLAERYGIRRVILFGSRARGDNRERSDIDLAVSGGNVTEFRLEIDEAVHTLLMFDVVNLDGPVQASLREAIEKEGGYCSMKKYDNFCDALKNLRLCRKYSAPYDVVTETGLVNLFSICFEQSWKVMKELLLMHGYDEGKTGSPRMIIKLAYSAGMIEDEKGWIELLDKRRESAYSYNEEKHSYNEEVAASIIEHTKKTYLALFESLQKELEENWL